MTTFATIQRLTTALDALTAARHELTEAGEIQAATRVGRALAEVRHAKRQAWVRYSKGARS